MCYNKPLLSITIHGIVGTGMISVYQSHIHTKAFLE